METFQTIMIYARVRDIYPGLVNIHRHTKVAHSG